LLWLFLYGTGVWVATWFDPAPLIPLLPFFGAVVWFRFRHRAANRSLSLFFFLLGLSMAALALGSARDNSHIKSLAGDAESNLLGKIVLSTRYDSGVLQLDLDRIQVMQEGRANPVRGKLRLTIKEAREDYPPGSWVQFRARIKQPERFGIPGEFDRPLYLASLGIFATSTLKNDRGIVMHPVEPGSLSWTEQLQRSRLMLIDHLGDRYPGRTGQLLRALLLGDKSGLDPELRQTLSRSGMSHLFSVSGLHLGLVAGFLYLGGAFLYRRSNALLDWQPASRIIPLLCLPCLWCYMILSGAAVPTQRAFLMAACGAGLLVVRRRTHAISLLTCVALILLLLQPLALFSPSFQLSLAGLWGIVYLVPKWNRQIANLPSLARRPLQVLLVTLAATLCTIPFSVVYFHQASIAGPLINLLAVPTVGLLVLPSGLLGLLLVWAGVPVGELLIGFSGWLLESMLRLVERLLDIPVFAGSAWYPDPLQLIALISIIALVLVPDFAGRQKRPLQILCLMLAALLVFSPNRQTSSLRLTSFSVGQGESSLVSVDGTRHFLIDGGGFYDSSFDVGSRLLAPALGWLGVHSLDRIILTHNHPDHSLGLGYILAQYQTTQFLTAAAADQLPYDPVTVASQRLFTPLPGWQQLEEGPQWSLHLFAPSQSAGELNDRSLVLYAGYGRDGLLLTGDLEQTGTHQLLKRPMPGPVTLLKLPHHGSRFSDTDILLKRIKPDIAFVSAGRNNPFGLPHPDVVAQVAAASVRLFRTDRDGSIQFQTHGDGWQVRPSENWLFH